MKQSKGFIVRILMPDQQTSYELRPEKTFAEAVMRLKRFMKPVGPPGLVAGYIVQQGRLLAEYVPPREEIRIMGEYDDQKESNRTPFAEKELMLDEDTIFYVVAVRQMADGSKWFLDIHTHAPTTVYGTWEPQPNGTKKLLRSTIPVQDLVVSFNPLHYRDKNMGILKGLVEAKGEGGYGPMRLVKVGRSIDVSDAKDRVEPVQRQFTDTEEGLEE